MTIRAVTLFPKMFDCLYESIIGRAIKSGIIDFKAVDIREYSADKHSKCDDAPYGGGAGMVMTVQPIYDCINAIDPNHEFLRVYMSPKGERLSDKCARGLAKVDKLLILCGHYEGVDQRAIDLCIDREISVGDYVLSGGEIPAMVLIDSILRYVPDVLGNCESTVDESFSQRLLEYPQYTRPQSFLGAEVPEVLVSGHHAKVEKWRREQSLEITRKVRPDLLEEK